MHDYKRATYGKRHYILPVCNMTSLNLFVLVFEVSFTPETSARPEVRGTADVG